MADRYNHAKHIGQIAGLLRTTRVAAAEQQYLVG